MPTSLSVKPFTIPKSYRLILLFILLPFFFYGQSLTGLWVGSLSNDSTTVRKDQSFEIALTEYKGKVYGYSRSEFIVDDTLFYILKRVKGTIEGDICEVTDDEIISYNFRGKLDKGIKVTSTFRRNKNDSTWYLEGTWKTNATKKYYSVTGKVGLEEEKDLTASKIFPHLEELRLANDVAFYKDRKEGIPIVKIVKPEKIKTEYSTVTAQIIPSTTTVAAVQPGIRRAETDPASVNANALTSPGEQAPGIIKQEGKEEIVAVKKPLTDQPRSETNNIPASNVTVQPSSGTRAIALNTAPIQNNTTAISNDPALKTSAPVITSQSVEKKITAPVNANSSGVKKDKQATPPQSPAFAIKPIPAEKKKDAPANNSMAGTPAATNSSPVNSQVKTDPVAITKTPAVATTSIPVVSTPAVPESKKTDDEIIAKAAVIGGRKSEFSQVVNFKSDSLELSLYDNGEIDGDTVSVYLNGEVLLEKQGLKAYAIKKTIHIIPGQQDEFTLVMFAESLGKYPPNTGLLVIHDGNDVYNLRFSSDFQKSSGIIFKRKTK